MDDTLYKAAAEGRANEDKHLSYLRRAGETVTFAACFTLPGGFRDKESIFQSICCVRYHSDDPLSRYCMVLFSYGNGLSFGWESACTLLSMWLYSHRVWDGSNGGSIHDRVVCFGLPILASCCAICCCSYFLAGYVVI